MWEEVITKIQNRLAGWKQRVLYKAGRATLVQSVTSNLLVYYLSLFKAPINVTKRIDKLSRDFLWEVMRTQVNAELKVGFLMFA